MNSATITTEQTWQSVLSEEKKKPYFQQILQFLAEQKAQNKTIYPPQQDIFRALSLTPFESTKVVIIGQDPYHGPEQAMGLSFAVNQGVAIPPSLRNIYKELHQDLGIPPASHGDLSHWAKQGVLLLNASLTVEAHKPQSHAKIGWQTFTDAIITSLNNHDHGIVFLLWGAYAQKKQNLIDKNKHHILCSTHPSPLSAHRGFLGSKPFSKTNALLAQLDRSPINWQL